MQELAFSQITKKLIEFDLPDFDLIVGIAEGGLIPASLVAYKLKTELKIIKINYRDEGNTPLYDHPVILSEINKVSDKKILIVDDVSVTGKTLEKAKELFPGNHIQTLTLKGKADHVLFPEISQCVNWPWKVNQNQSE